MANDQDDDKPSAGSADPDEVRLIGREEAQASLGSGSKRVSSDSLREANLRARREGPVPADGPSVEENRQISMRIDEAGVLDLREDEDEFDAPHGQAPVSGSGQPRLPTFTQPYSNATRTEAKTEVIDPNAWLSGLGQASRLGKDDDADQTLFDETNESPGSSGFQTVSASADDENGLSNDPEGSTAGKHGLPGETEADGRDIVSPSGSLPGTVPEAPTSPEVAGGEPGNGSGRSGDKPFANEPSDGSVRKSFTERTQEARISLPKRIGTGIAFAGAAIGAFAGGPTWTLALVAAVLMFAAVEYFDGLRRVGFKPATALGLLAVFGCTVAAYTKGEQGLLFVAAASVFFTLVWYLAGIVRQAPTANIAVTLLGIFWIGVLGSFAGLMLRMPEREGMTILIGAVLVTAAYDTAAYAGGVMFGRRKLAPSISPTKTVEGLLAGTAAAVVVGAVIVSLMSPWSLTDALVLGLVVSVLAPLGDLAESMVKRDLGLKDMGRILPGHGGVLDRFDALLLVLPGTFYLATFLNV